MVIFFKLYLVAFLVFFVIDMVWLGVVAKNLYQNQIGHLLKSQVNWIAAIVFYLLFIAGLVFFVLMPAVDKGSLSYALLAGAFFGFITYATYDLTNLATLEGWPWQITVIDLVWGTVLGASTSLFAYILYQWIF